MCLLVSKDVSILQFLYLFSLLYVADLDRMFRYDATIDSHTPNGYYVTYDGWGNKEEVIYLPSCMVLFSNIKRSMKTKKITSNI